MIDDLNRFLCTGNLGADPECRVVASGATCCTFRVGVSRTADQTDWMRVVAWDELAAICAERLQRGTRVMIEGRVQTRT